MQRSLKASVSKFSFKTRGLTKNMWLSEGDNLSPNRQICSQEAAEADLRFKLQLLRLKKQSEVACYCHL